MTGTDSARLQGSLCAMVTPFRNGEVDLECFRALVDWHIDQGTRGLVPCGTTGETPTLTKEEWSGLVDACVKEAGGRVPVIAGTGTNATASTIENTKNAMALGADAVLVVVPYYNKPTQEGLYAHFKAVHDAVELPIIVYNIPGRSAVDMSVETLALLAELPRIVGVKDATGDLARVSHQRARCGSGFVQLSGEDGSALGFNAHGGVGCISVTANVAPKECAEFQEAMLEGDYAKALSLQDRLMALHDALFIEASPAPVKYGLSLLDRCGAEVRLPLVPASETAQKAVRKAMQTAGLIGAN